MGFSSAYLNARARALIGQILPARAIEGLAELPTADEVVKRLEADGYFRHDVPDDAALSAVQRLREQLDRDYRAAMTVVPEPGRSVVRAMYGRHEAEFVKTIVGCAHHGLPPAVRARLAGASHLLDKEKEAALLEAPTLADAAQRAPAQYQATLANALHRVEEVGSLFPLEIALDLQVLHEMWVAAQGLTGRDAASVDMILGVWFDIFNITSASRLAQVFRLGPDETLSYLLHHGRFLRLSHRRALAQAQNMSLVLSALWDVPYGPVATRAESIAQLERALEGHFRDILSAQIGGYPFHLGVTVAYLFMKELEIRDISRVIEAKEHRGDA